MVREAHDEVFIMLLCRQFGEAGLDATNKPSPNAKREWVEGDRDGSDGGGAGDGDAWEARFALNTNIW